MEQNQKPKFKMDDARKIHPKAGLKWQAKEDESLKKMYAEFRAGAGVDFDAFLAKLIVEFGRAAGGLKARLAKYFDDVPGWDYSRDKFRAEELNKKVDAIFTLEHNEILRMEYQKYLESKRETYMGFLKRVSRQFSGVKGEFISRRLAQLVGNPEKYGRDDVSPFGSYVGAGLGRPLLDEDMSSQFDFSNNPQAQAALKILRETNENLFLTGEAGTGKSALLQYFRAATDKNAVVLAPTGVAALNVFGQTIHSFCSFGPDITLQKVKKLGPGSGKFQLLQKLNTVIIDEISMVRADLLDCVDKFLRLNGPLPAVPFGGIQMVFIGDLHQLPPVEKGFPLRQGYGGQVDGGEVLLKEYQNPYFFDSRAFKTAKFRYVQLKTVYRQKDQIFIDALNAVRNNLASASHLTLLNQRALSSGAKFTFEKFAIYLTTTNQQARRVNNFFLERLSAKLKTYQGQAMGSFEDRELPTDLNLQVKIGAQVMMLNNDYRKRWVNGTMGKIVGIAKNKSDDEGEDASNSSDMSRRSYKLDDGEPATSDTIIVELETGETVYVLPHTWEMFQFTLDKQTQKIDSRTTGVFTQYPFKLAWAVTIHKAQGKTFDKVYIDLSTGAFAHGQLYVALSRCRTLQGLYLKRPITQADIILDQRIVKFLDTFTFPKK